MSSARKIGSLAVMAGFLLLTTATSKPKSDTTSSTSTTATTSPTSSPASGGKPTDVDVVLLTTVLGCTKGSPRPGCKLLADFDDATTWVDVPVVDSVYFGEATGIGDLMDGKKEFYFLQIGAGGPGQFAGVGRELYPDNPKEAADSAKLAAAVRIGGSVPGSDAAKYMKTAPPPSEGRHVLTLTNGKSHVLAGTVTYLRKKGNRVMFVEYSGNPLGDPKRPGRTASAWVGELFKLNQ